ncbi:DUF2125 domain-containing protein [Phenylobacterium sp.]|jgi:hypothetical protein|uniref:DUF2125 domain-containing protein n=1 Tax=Phenylobacterium sp. TaxID=1871053 RepID=UPI002E34C93B|nr:DUF2125 domain-containing protein [Phenylobacterium sp.]HEX4710064.1 DUF2125 domain-containing protein [Phenylobacterium sp.]
MSVHDPSPPRKPRRLGLYLPFVALGLAIAAWSGVWVWAKGQAQTRLDAAAQGLAQAGWQLSWKDRAVTGYPFRLDVSLTDVRLREPTGWALEAPRIEGEAFMHAPTQWLIAAPEGLTFVRPQGGRVTVKGDLIRASLSHFDAHPPSFSFEGVKLTFAPQPGAQPFALTAADRVEVHLRAGPDNQGGVFVRLDNGKARLSGLFARVAGDKPISLVWNSTLSKMSAFSGPDWPSAVRHWADAGGSMTVRQAGITAGDAVVGANSGSLAVGRDGRLTGVLDVTLRQAPRALGALGDEGVIDQEAARAATAVAQARQGGGEAAQATLNFQAGRTTFGPVALGPAPKIYEPR